MGGAWDGDVAVILDGLGPDVEQNAWRGGIRSAEDLLDEDTGEVLGVDVGRMRLVHGRVNAIMSEGSRGERARRRVVRACLKVNLIHLLIMILGLIQSRG